MLELTKMFKWEGKRVQTFLNGIKRIGTCVDLWQGCHQPSMARVILANICLSNLPTFQMGLFLLGDGVHGVMYKRKVHFFWEGADLRSRYNMVNWPAVCFPKSFQWARDYQHQSHKHNSYAQMGWKLLGRSQVSERSGASPYPYPTQADTPSSSRWPQRKWCEGPHLEAPTRLPFKLQPDSTKDSHQWTASYQDHEEDLTCKTMKT
jgi:hypothetical protein